VPAPVRPAPQLGALRQVRAHAHRLPLHACAQQLHSRRLHPLQGPQIGLWTVPGRLIGRALVRKICPATKIC
jgi:hypothetical protein